MDSAGCEAGITGSGFPHSEIPGSKPACGSPGLIAACHVLHRLLAPRHPPYALSSLTIKLTQVVAGFAIERRAFARLSGLPFNAPIPAVPFFPLRDLLRNGLSIPHSSVFRHLAMISRMTLANHRSLVASYLLLSKFALFHSFAQLEQNL